MTIKLKPAQAEQIPTIYDIQVKAWKRAYTNEKLKPFLQIITSDKKKSGYLDNLSKASTNSSTHFASGIEIIKDNLFINTDPIALKASGLEIAIDDKKPDEIQGILNWKVTNLTSQKSPNSSNYLFIDNIDAKEAINIAKKYGVEKIILECVE